MSISVHTRSVSMSKNGAHKFGYGLAKHVSRDEKDGQEVFDATDSNINPKATKYNVNLTPDFESNFYKAQGLINKRNSDRAKLGSNYEKIAPDLKILNKEKRKLKKELKSLNDNQADTKLIEVKRAELDAKLKEIEPLKAIKDESKMWDSRTAVGGISTFQLSKETLKRGGWIFDENDNALSVDEQLKKHPKSVESISNLYKGLYAGIKSHSERYGSVISASIHFDESIPHLDVFTLNIGQDLNGNWQSKHIGEVDNGTGGERLNIRQRTYTNGTNKRGKNKAWKRQAQDNLDNDFKEGMKAQFNMNLTDNVINDWDLKRGDPINSEHHKFKAKIGRAKHKAEMADSMMAQASKTSSEAELALNNAKTHAKSITSSANSNASDIIGSANSNASNTIFNANSVANSIVADSLAIASASYAKSIKASLAIRNEIMDSKEDDLNQGLSSNASLAIQLSAESSNSSLKNSRARSMESMAEFHLSSADNKVASADTYYNHQSSNANKFKRAMMDLMTVGIQILTGADSSTSYKLGHGELQYNNNMIPNKSMSPIEIGFYNLKVALNNGAPSKQSTASRVLNAGVDSMMSKSHSASSQSNHELER